MFYREDLVLLNLSNKYMTSTPLSKEGCLSFLNFHKKGKGLEFSNKKGRVGKIGGGVVLKKVGEGYH